MEPASCAEDNDGTVSAEVTDVDDCSLLARGGTVAVTVVDGRTYCLTDRCSPASGSAPACGHQKSLTSGLS